MGRAAKRAFDVIMSAALLLLLSPVILTVAVLVLFVDGWPIFFRQLRPGHHAAPFILVKFRTMTESASDSRASRSDQHRLTSLGRFLRRLSLDELPQLWNVFKGEMSLVGPRPLLMQYLDRYSPEQARRHDAVPGITGWAQINGRNAITWEQRFAYDVWYVDHWSLMLDARILFLTFWHVLKREGISSPGEATMPEFQGKQDAAT